ncbi:ATP-binding cassette domain-containing protein [Pseudonocardia sp.]|uniref:ATP-binding cassette domain-containing protein n=1 Tax=Pseudonocardia sp. TaxID=60912 RepID=UPI0031FBFCDF
MPALRRPRGGARHLDERRPRRGASLLGTNGAGKTTTVEVLEGLHRADGGRVRVLGHDLVRDRALVHPRTHPVARSPT